jgi:cathepsin L
MRVYATLCLVLLLAVSVQALFRTEREYQSEFTNFMIKFNKKYSADELFSRYDNFKTKLDLVTEWNSQPDITFTKGINAYSDLSSAEMKKKLNGYRPKPTSAKNYAMPNSDIELPASVDWRTQNAVTAVKDQGQCGSCWAFSTTGSVEGAYALATKNLISLSEQQLMDCSQAEGNESCEGGLMDDAFQFIIKNKGICSEADYPYQEKDEACKTGCKSVATISSYADIPSGNETAMGYAVAVQPLSIAIEADQSVFQDYQSGVLNSAACGTNLDHGVLIVGYGHDAKSGLDYWIVKNSWGKSWGMDGYVWLARGFNTCGLDLAASYPIV